MSISQSTKYETIVLLTFQKSKFECRNYRLAHFIIYFQIFNQNLIWSWIIYIACFLRCRDQWVCNNIKCAHVFCAILINAISKAIALLSSYKFALRHISMRRSHLFSKRSNSKSSNLHMLAKVFRVNSRFWFTSWFLDSRRFFHFFSIFEHRQEHSVICWIDSWIISNVSRVENEWRFLLWESIDLKKSLKFFVFESLISDSFTQRESLLWRSSKSC